MFLMEIRTTADMNRRNNALINILIIDTQSIDGTHQMSNSASIFYT